MDCQFQFKSKSWEILYKGAAEPSETAAYSILEH
jgi:hypothetical protein